MYDCTASSCAGNDADKRYKYLFAMRDEDGRVLAYTSPTDNVTFLETYYDAEGHRVYVNTREWLCEQLLAGVKPVHSKTTDRTDASTVYDLQGRRMDGRNLPKGVYIQGGKKFVVK